MFQACAEAPSRLQLARPWLGQTDFRSLCDQVSFMILQTIGVSDVLSLSGP